MNDQQTFSIKSTLSPKVSIESNTPPPLKTAMPGDETKAMSDLKLFLQNAPKLWRSKTDPPIQKFKMGNGEEIACVFWKGRFFISGTDVVKVLLFRFHNLGRSVLNPRKFEEGVFSDLRNIRPGTHAVLEEPRSEFLEFLDKHGCLRTQKKQKVYFWDKIPHDDLFKEALERNFKRASSLYNVINNNEQQMKQYAMMRGQMILPGPNGACWVMPNQGGPNTMLQPNVYHPSQQHHPQYNYNSQPHSPFSTRSSTSQSNPTTLRSEKEKGKSRAKRRSLSMIDPTSVKGQPSPELFFPHEQIQQQQEADFNEDFFDDIPSEICNSIDPTLLLQGDWANEEEVFDNTSLEGGSIQNTVKQRRKISLQNDYNFQPRLETDDDVEELTDNFLPNMQDFICPPPLPTDQKQEKSHQDALFAGQDLPNLFGDDPLFGGGAVTAGVSGGEDKLLWGGGSAFNGDEFEGLIPDLAPNKRP